MSRSFDNFVYTLLNPTTFLGAAFFGLLFLCLAAALAAVIRRLSKDAERHLTDVTGLRFATAFVQVSIFVIGFILYAHLIPRLRALATALLAGVSIMSLVLGLAAQNTLSNLIAGISLILYRPVSIGDTVQLTTPKGLVTARVELLSLGKTLLRDTEGNEIIVPNNVMANSVVIKLGPKTAVSRSTRSAGDPQKD